MTNRPLRQTILCLLVTLASLYATRGHACYIFFGDAPEKVLSREDWIAAADLVVSGKIIARVDHPKRNRATTRVRVTQNIKGSAPVTLVVQDRIASTCGSGAHYLLVGQWWTLYLRRERSEYFVKGVEAFCASDGKAETGVHGHCRHTLRGQLNFKRLTVADKSELVVGPNRDLRDPWSIKLADGSSVVSVALPEGTVAMPRGDWFSLPKEISIGPLKISGQVRFGPVIYPPGSINMYIAEPGQHDGDQGVVLLHGAEAKSVIFRMPDVAVIEARFSKPVVIKGYHIADYARFDDSGDLTEFRSARAQVINGHKVKTCDDVRLDHGQPVHLPFYNVCKAK